MASPPSDQDLHDAAGAAEPQGSAGGHGWEGEVRRLGASVRRTRQRLGMSVEQLAERSDLSVGSISQLERGIGNPAYRSMAGLASALGMSVSQLLDASQEPGSALVRADGRSQLPPIEPGDGARGLRRELLTPHLRLPLQVIRTELPPGFTNRARPFRRLGWECVHVLAGVLHVEVGQQLYELDEGDSLTYECTLAHWWSNPGSATAVVLGSATPFA